MSPGSDNRTGMSRRSLLSGIGAAGVGAAGVAGLAGCGPDSPAASAASASTGTVPFRGTHQAGIATPAPERMILGAFDMTSTSRAALVEMLRSWTAAAVAMTEGKPVPGGAFGEPLAPPEDTGEAVGHPPSDLTITVGFGPSLFDDRFGLAHRRPAELAELPPLPGENLDPARSGGDIGLQVCANDPVVAFHALRNLTKIARGTAVLRWSQQGFGRTASTGSEQQTPRNLMGFKDGTRNIRGDDTAAMNRHVWVGPDSDQQWFVGGSYLIARRIRMLIESWDRDYLRDQHETFGRYKRSGAPLTGEQEFDTPDLGAKDRQGDYVIPADAHIRLASRETNHGIQILRRGYSYTDGIDPATGGLDAGLFFICYQRHPSQFVELQRKLGSHDALTEYISHESSAVFACPPGVEKDQWWGQALFT